MSIVDLDEGVLDDEPNQTTRKGNPEAFDSADYDDPSMVDNVVRNQIVPDTDLLPRYAVSFLLPISLFRQNGNNSFGDYNPKDPNTGANTVNFNYYPPFRIMPIVGGTFNIPFEMKSTESKEPTKSAAFDFNDFMKSPPAGFDKAVRNAKECSEIYERENRSSGGRIIHTLTGYHQHDADKGVQAARYLVGLLLPVRDEDQLPVTERLRNGILFKGPFLDEIYEWVVANGVKVIQADKVLSPADKETAMKVVREIRKHLQDGANIANKMLDETEAEIRNPDETKKSYDLPDLETDDPPVSTDLYCLAHTKRIEIANQQLAASETIGKGLSDPMTAALNKMTEVVEKFGSVPASVPAQKDVMTPDQVSKLLDDQAATLTAKFQQMMTDALAAQQPAAPVETGDKAKGAAKSGK